MCLRSTVLQTKSNQPAPSPVIFSFTEIEDHQKQLNEEMLKWRVWQESMEAAYASIIKMEDSPDYSVETRILTYEKFLTEFGTNNPHTDDDNELRDEAQTWVDYHTDILENYGPRK